MGFVIKLLKKITVVYCVILWIYLWFLLISLGSLFARGPDAHFILDDNYEIWDWPGLLFRIEVIENKTHPEMSVVLNRSARIDTLAVLDKFIIGKTVNDNWFAVDRQTHKLWYPHSSKEELQREADVSFPDSALITSFPRTYLHVPRLGKILVLVIHTFFAVILVVFLLCALIGFRRIGRGLKFLVTLGRTKGADKTCEADFRY